VIVLDTSVLSLAFRRAHRNDDVPQPVLALRKWITDDISMAVPGIVLQELLSGVRRTEPFRKLRETMTGFSILWQAKAITFAQHKSTTRVAGMGWPARRSMP